MYCAPHNKTEGRVNGSCYHQKELLDIFNNLDRASKSIVLNGKDSVKNFTKEELWNRLHGFFEPMYKSREDYWMEHVKLSDKDVFVPKTTDTDMYNMLWSIDLINVMKQYEKVYNNFVFLGVVPLDFKEVAYNKTYGYKYDRYIPEGKTKFGMIINYDKSYEEGSHWVALFIDFISNQISFFDSGGKCPPISEISNFMDFMVGKFPKLQKLCNSTQHQFDGVECGVYCCYFIISSLQNVKFNVFLNDIIPESKMVKYRETLFRPWINIKGGYIGNIDKRKQDISMLFSVQPRDDYNKLNKVRNQHKGGEIPTYLSSTGDKMPIMVTKPASVMSTVGGEIVKAKGDFDVWSAAGSAPNMLTDLKPTPRLTGRSIFIDSPKQTAISIPSISRADGARLVITDPPRMQSGRGPMSALEASLKKKIESLVKADQPRMYKGGELVGNEPLAFNLREMTQKVYPVPGEPTRMMNLVKNSPTSVIGMSGGGRVESKGPLMQRGGCGCDVF